MSGLLVGCPVSPSEQDLAAQFPPGLVSLPSGSTAPWPAPTDPTPAWGLAACRAGDTLVVTNLDRLARSLPNARDIPEELAATVR